MHDDGFDFGEFLGDAFDDAPPLVVIVFTVGLLAIIFVGVGIYSFHKCPEPTTNECVIRTMGQILSPDDPTSTAAP